MDTAIHAISHRPAADVPLRPVSAAHTVSVSALYFLSETGRKASLLAGGDGRARQELAIQIPATRMHLVSVDQNGHASLKLQPRYEVAADERIIRHNTPPRYDAPPTLDELFHDAARNHELERTFKTQRTTFQHHRREANQERRARIAQAFLDDPTQRAMVHPQPAPTWCFLATAEGRVMFNRAKDVGPARALPKEAYRRFVKDLRARRERGQAHRAQQDAVSEAKQRYVAAWLQQHGSPDQRERLAAGLLPTAEVVAALDATAFINLDHVPRYERQGATELEAHLRRVTGRADLVVESVDMEIFGVNAPRATGAQWEALRALHAAAPNDDVRLREHRLTWRRDPQLPPLIAYGALVIRHVGPFVLRREFAAPAR